MTGKATWRRAGMAGVGGVLALISPAAAACSDDGSSADDCGTVACGPTVVVMWEAGAVPDAASYEVCSGDACTTAEAEASPDGSFSVDITGDEFEPDGDTAHVTMEALDDNGERLAFFEDDAQFTEGPCCRGSAVEANGDGGFDQIEPAP
jgi:hypothetical protein